MHVKTQFNMKNVYDQLVSLKRWEGQMLEGVEVHEAFLRQNYKSMKNSIWFMNCIEFII